jgi:hypothetical protein
MIIPPGLVGNFNLLLSVIPTTERFAFLTINSIMIGIAGFLAPNLGAFIIDLLEGLFKFRLIRS